MPILIWDRTRAASWSQRHLDERAKKCVVQASRYGGLDSKSLPSWLIMEIAGLRDEYSRRGIQLRLF